MRAVVISAHGGSEVLELRDHPVEPPQSGQVQVAMQAVGLNHLDLWVRSGMPGISLPLVPGSDGAGVISAVGPDVQGFSVGDEVVIQPGTYCGVCDACLAGRENFCPDYGIIGETGNGLLQDSVNITALNAYKKPAGLTWPGAGSFGLVFLTAYEMLAERARLLEGETVLVLGGSSGIGAAAIQIANRMGARVIATASPGAKTEFALSMGADTVVDHYAPDWHREVLEAAGPSRVQVVIEHIGAATWSESMHVLGLGGRIVVCGATTGPRAGIELRHLFRKQQSVLGSTMGSVKSFEAVLRGFADGSYRPIVDKVFPLTEIAAAHDYLESRNQKGKVVISLGADQGTI